MKYNKTREDVQSHPICLSDSGNDYILDKIKRRKIFNMRDI